MSEKTEDPTPRRLRQAQEEGQSGASSFASRAVSFLVAMALVPTALLALVERATADIKAAIAKAAEPEVTVRIDAAALAWQFISLVTPLLIAIAVTGAVTHLVQTGGFIATKRLGLKFDNLNIVRGFKNLFSPTALFSVARSLLGAALVAWIAYIILKGNLRELASATGRLDYIGSTAARMARSLGWAAAILGLALGAIDILISRRRWLSQLRMTKEEVKREHKEQEGDPEIKAARKRAHEQVLEAQQLDNVKHAAVVVVNPTHLACALRYDGGPEETPTVVARGRGDFAQRIIRAAHEAGVPVIRDVPLAQALLELSVGDEIPDVLHVAVGAILREAMGLPPLDEDEHVEDVR
jgi:flagellar biosynthesis protein FlhB